MEHIDELAKYKTLCQKNKKDLEQISEHIYNNPDPFGCENQNYRQLRQQYDIILTSSKDSI